MQEVPLQPQPVECQRERHHDGAVVAGDVEDPAAAAAMRLAGAAPLASSWCGLVRRIASALCVDCRRRRGVAPGRRSGPRDLRLAAPAVEAGRDGQTEGQQGVPAGDRPVGLDVCGDVDVEAASNESGGWDEWWERTELA